MFCSVNERIEKFTKWFNQENEAPVIGFFYDSQYPLHRYPSVSKNFINGPLHPDQIIVEDYFSDCDRLFNIYKKSSGDFLWSSAAFPGVPWIEASLGCEVIADGQTGSTHTKPPGNFMMDPCIPRFSHENPWIKKLFEFNSGLINYSQGRYGVGMTLVRGISDILSALYGGHNFVMRLYEEPEEVKSLTKNIVNYWIDFGRQYMDSLELYKGGTGSLFYSIWAPGRTIWIQEDAAALLSPELYEEFIFPYFCEVINAFENTIIHLHPSQFIPVDYLLKTNITAIEMHIDIGGPSAKDLAITHQKVLKEKPLFIWGNLSETDLEYILKNQQHEGLCIGIAVDSYQQANHLIKMSDKWLR